MQPTFLPWLGYFALLDAVDAFVFLDDVQLSRQSWQTRNRVLGPDGPLTLSLPVARRPSRPSIAEARLAAEPARLRALVRTLGASLARAPHGPETMELVERAFAAAGDSLLELNVGLIEAVAGLVGIDTARVRASELDATAADRSGRLLAICRRLGAREYLSPIGALDYLDGADPFAGTEVRLRFARYEHPRYAQPGGRFESHLSALDALARVGPEAFLALVRSGVRPALPIEDARDGAPA